MITNTDFILLSIFVISLLILIICSYLIGESTGKSKGFLKGLSMARQIYNK